MASKVDFLKKTLVIITGASQGIGRVLAVELSKRLVNNSVINLIARSEKGLLETKKLISEENDKITTNLHSIDLTNPDISKYDELFENLDFEQAIIFHNVGQIGVLNETIELTDIQTWRDYFDLNVFSVGILNSVFVKKLRNKVGRLVAVNVTSLCGRKPFQNMAMYGSGKAARELYFRVFALEESEVTVLNYSPGPVDTAMVEEVLDKVKDAEVKGMFQELKEKKTILTPKETVEKLLSILGTGDFKSGDVIDYYDRI